MAKTAREKLAAGPDDPGFYEDKLITGRFFMQRMLPDTGSLLSKVMAGADSMMALKAEAF